MHRSRLIILLGMLIAASVFFVGNRLRQEPAWLEEIIDNLEHSNAAADSSVYIARYEYQGKTVYYVSPRCCDEPSALYNAQGVLLCEPDGGFTGRGDGRCGDFLATRRNERMIWRGRSRAA
jgi:hypothetical protein